MGGLDKISFEHDHRNYGLIDFCTKNAETALGDAKRLLNKFKQEKNVKVRRLKSLLQNNGKRLLFVLKEQEIEYYISRVEKAMFGLGITLQAASLVRTNTACVPFLLASTEGSHG